MTEQRPIAGARGLLRQCRHASLATLRPDGSPFVTLVAMATDAQGDPLLLLSDLARHSANLASDSRVSLLLDGTAGMSERLTGARLTLTGTLVVCERSDDVARRYLAQHPEAAMLLELADFRFYRMTVTEGHQVAGFGRIDAIEASDLLVEPELASELAGVEPGAISHMMDDHVDALALLAGTEGQALLQVIDADGMTLHADGQAVRVMFPERLQSASQLRTTIVEVVRQIRRN